MKHTFRLLSIFTTCLIASAVACGQTAQNKTAEEGTEELILKLYPLGELSNPSTTFPFDPTLPTAGKHAAQPLAWQNSGGHQGGGGSLGGGGFGGGGGGGGGGGFFSVPTNVQLGQPGSGMSPGSGGGNSGLATTNLQISEIVNAIMAVIAPDSWDYHGGPGSMSVARNVLIVRQTAAVHKQVGTLLEELKKHTIGGPSMTLEIWWLPVTEKSKQALSTQLNAEDAIEKINDLCDALGGYRGTIRARNHTTANIVSGQRMPLVTGSVPVVGNGAMGEQPIVRHINVGIVAEASLQLNEDRTNDDIKLNLRTALTRIDDFEDLESTGGEIDRFRFGNHVLEAATSCSSGKPIVVGSLSTVGDDEAEEGGTETVVVVCVTLNRTSAE